VLGCLNIARPEPGPFSDNQVALLQTFADQAVIAIENVRLFTELQQKNEALTQAHAQVTEALEQQTATSEVLRTISQSQTDVQPVFDTILANSVRLCGSRFAAVFRVSNDLIHLVAHNMPADWLAAARYPQRITPESAGGVAVLQRQVVHIPNLEGDDR